MSTYVNLLISNGTDVNAKNTYGETPLFLCNHQKSLLSLIKHGADVGILSNDNETPLFTCRKFSYLGSSHILKGETNLKPIFCQDNYPEGYPDLRKE